MGTRVRIIWEKWNCTSCDKKGISAEPPPGETQPRCPNCGNPREQNDGEETYLDNRIDPRSGKILDANVADTKEELEIALAGPDWTCSRCGGDNRASRNACVGCGSAREDRAWDGITPISMPRDTVPAPSHRRATPPSYNYQPRELDSIGANDVSWGKVGIGALVVLCIIGMAIFTWWAVQTHEVDGTVTALTWQQTINRETYAKVTASDWQSDISGTASKMPVNGTGEYAGESDIRNCQSKHYSDRKYSCGTTHVCESKNKRVPNGSHESCSHHKNGNGSVTETCHDVTDYKSVPYQDCHDETKYCTEPIYHQWCDYTTYQWANAGSMETHGDGTSNMVWPNVVAGPLDRLTREGDYRIYISYTDGGSPEKISRTAETDTIYRTWALNEKVKLEVRNIGTVSEVKRLTNK